MQFEERLNTQKLQYLNALTFDEYYLLNPTKDNGKKITTKKDKEEHFKYFKLYCSTMLKAGGTSTRYYKQNDGMGRYWCGSSMQGMMKSARGFLMDGVGTDIDMVNCHPTLMLSVCKKVGIDCPYLSYYILNRNELIAKNPGVDVKNDVIQIMYGTGKSLSIDFLKNFKKECKDIQKKLLQHEDYKKYLELVKEEKDNKVGSACSKILEDYEKDVIKVVIEYLRTKRAIDIAVLMHDGVLVYGDYYDQPELLKGLEAVVEESFPGLKMGFAYKAHSTVITMPHDFVYKEPEINDEENFMIMAKEFEKTHAKILDRGEYIQEVYMGGRRKSFKMITEDKLLKMYKHLNYLVTIDNRVVEKPFIVKWIGYTNPNIRLYRDIECYPNSALCPEDIYNSWDIFDAEFLDGLVADEAGLKFMLNHIYILCGKEKAVYDYFIKWIGHSIQFPEQKCGIAPVFISEEGAGKGSLLNLMRKMMGEKKVEETTAPERDIWGHFNGKMASSYLVNINEVSKKNLQDAYGRIKALITDDSLTINEKGLSQFSTKSYHRFILTTNNEEPINTASGDRRFFVVRSSDELVRNHVYFTQFNQLLASEDLVKHCYEYFKTLPDVEGFIRLPIPETEHHKNLKELGKSKERLWLEWYVSKNSDKDEIVATSKDVFDSFKQFLEENGTEKYDITSLTLGVRLKNMKLRGITKGAHTMNGSSKCFNNNVLRKELGLFLFEEDYQTILPF